MSIQITCEVCEKELEGQGALIFSPPHNKICDKYHVCWKCFIKLQDALRDLKYSPAAGQEHRHHVKNVRLNILTGNLFVIVTATGKIEYKNGKL